VNAAIRNLLPILIVWISVLWTGAAVSADAIPGESLCDRPVDSIVFSGNSVTRPQVLLREIIQQIDTSCSLDQIVDSIQGIMDLGLFKSVYANLSLTDEGLQLQFTVKEKHYFIIVPRISRTSDALRNAVKRMMVRVLADLFISLGITYRDFLAVTLGLVLNWQVIGGN